MTKNKQRQKKRNASNLPRTAPRRRAASAYKHRGKMSAHQAPRALLLHIVAAINIERHHIKSIEIGAKERNQGRTPAYRRENIAA